ncbi:MAG: AmmeMemoRadiSam system protein B [Oscillospiraceae bacterium]
MKRRYDMMKKYAVTAAVMMILSQLCGCSAENAAESTAESAYIDEPVTEYTTQEAQKIYPLLDCNFYIERDFRVYTASPEEYDVSGELLCGTVPHHLTGGRLISSFFYTAAQNRGDVDTIVIVATKHYKDGGAFVTSKCGWQTPFGVMENDIEVTERLMEVGAAEHDMSMEEDHAVSSLIPFAKYYFPEAKISAVLVGAAVDKKTPDKLAAALTELYGERNILTVFSVDFSHYLQPYDTAEHDEETRRAVLAGDLSAVAAMTDSNMDSPYCIGTFMRLTDNLGGGIAELDHSNSLEMSGLPYSAAAFPEGLTSYFVFGGVK